MKKYHANHFVYELERANERIEMLSSINLMASKMSEKNELKIFEPISL